VTKIFFVVVGIFCALPVLASDVEVLLLRSEEWTAAEKLEIEQATKVAFSRMLRADVANCAYRNSYRENKDRLRKLWGSQIPILNKTKKVQISIRKTADQVLGKAVVGLAKIDRRQY